jgi:hypothetical protein
VTCLSSKKVLDPSLSFRRVHVNCTSVSVQLQLTSDAYGKPFKYKVSI